MFKVIKTLKNTVIRYPQFEFAYQEIKNSFYLKQSLDVVQHIFCLGAAGTGKSTLKQQIEKCYPRQMDCDTPDIPVLIVNIPAIPTVKNVAETMLATLGDPVADKGSTASKIIRILHYLKVCKTQLIIFDELQHFIDQGKKNTPYQVSDWLKTLVDQSNIPTVLMGLERSEQILQINEQLRRRFNRKIFLNPFSINDQKEYEIFAGIILKLQQLLNYSVNFDLQDVTNLKMIHYATNGIIDYMVKIMLGAYQVALEAGKNAITQDDFYHAFKRFIWNDVTDQLNPFHTAFSWQPLTKLNMPFHIAEGYRQNV